MKLYPCGANSSSADKIMKIAVNALSTTKIKPIKPISTIIKPTRESR